MEMLVSLPVGLEPDDFLTDAQLSALALAAEPEPPLGDDAVPIDLHPGQRSGALPSWYMPPAGALRCTGWRMPVVVVLVVTLVTLEALGLCSIFGQVVIG